MTSIDATLQRSSQNCRGASQGKLALRYQLAAYTRLVKVIGLSGPASAQSATTTLVGGRPLSPPPRNVWIALGGDPLSAVLTRARRFIACVRRNGISNLPDPKVGGGQVWLMLPPGLSRNSSRVRVAQRACRRLLPQPRTTRRGSEPGLTTTRP